MTATVLLVAVLIWLYRSPKMRVYYALVSNTQLPDELEEHADEIIAPSRLELALTRAEEVIEPNIEIAAGLLIVFVCNYAYVTV